MQFNEPSFLLLLLPVTLAVYYLVPARVPSLRNLVLVVASLIFGVWGAKYTIGVLLVALAINYALGILIGRQRSKAIVVAGVVANLALLVWCKYADFLHLPLPKIPSPPGLSFFTFVAIAYLVDVYRGEAKPVADPLGALNYFLFFSKFFAGLIVRYRDVGAQLTQREQRLDLFAAGVRRFIIGLGKKVLIANTVSVVADKVFAVPVASLTPSLAWLGVISYTLQIYFDFSGYTDMAIGLGAMFGFKFPENFNYPYVSTSIREFWRRWHMTLSGWLRDYLYISLGGSRCAEWRVYLNMLIVFFICGLWHGASWTFVVWGLLQGVFLLIERFAGNKELPRPVGHAYALLVTMVSWVFFRADTLTQAIGFLGAMFGLNQATGGADGVAALVDTPTLLAMLAGVLGSFPIVPAIRSRLPAREALAAAALTIVLLMVLVMTAVKTYTPFIYQKF